MSSSRSPLTPKRTLPTVQADPTAPNEAPGVELSNGLPVKPATRRKVISYKMPEWIEWAVKEYAMRRRFSSIGEAAEHLLVLALQQEGEPTPGED